MSSFAQFFIRASKHKDYIPAPFDARLRFYSPNNRNFNLVSDCFGHLVKYLNRKTTGLVLLKGVPTRHIAEDNLCAHFLRRHYQPPVVMTLGAPLIDPPVPYDEFLLDTVSSAFGDEQTEQNNMGSNRLRYIVGEPGEGKSAFLARMITEIERERTPAEAKISADPYKLICVRVDLEDYFDRSTHEPKPLNPDFLHHLFDALKRTTDSRLRDDEATMPLDWDTLTVVGDPVIPIQRLISGLRQAGYRVVLFIDNVDYYANCWERYLFFPEYNRQTEVLVDTNLRWLHRQLTAPINLGNAGLCVVLALRPATFHAVFNSQYGTETSRSTSLAYQLAPVAAEEIIRSRLALLYDAVRLIGASHHGESTSLDAFYRELAKRFADAHATTTASDKGSEAGTPTPRLHPLQVIYRLGQHGHRSLINFFSTLNFGYDETNLVERFFANEPVTLLELYFNNNYRKYSQKKTHFPNLFLNDCIALKNPNFPAAHQPHVHTYWLKLFILSYVQHERHATLRDLLSVFASTERAYHYEPHLVRLAVGSLATSDESACLRLDADTTQAIDDRMLVITRRGETLLGAFLGTPMYLSFRYLSALTDDYLMSYPPDIMTGVFEPRLDSSCLFAAGDRYITDSTDKLFRKAKACLYFLGVLRDSLEAELEVGKIPAESPCKEIAEGIDFPASENEIISSTRYIISQLRSPTLATNVMNDLRRLADGRKSYKADFIRYLQSRVLVAE